MDENEIKYIIGNSAIHGNGVIAKTEIKKGEIIGVAVYLTARGPLITRYLGVYVNHSKNPNACLIQHNLNYHLTSIKDISAGDEITGDYNQTPPFLAKAESYFA
jgi:SET domain-containing protein